MPIRLNLLAEEQAAEELRRRDPVKRAMWIAGFLVSAMLLWAVWLQVRTMMAQRALGKVEKEIARNGTEFQQVLDYQNKSADIDSKLAALHKLATNRFLNGTLLNALQQTTADNVQLLRLRVEQTYAATEETKTKTTDAGRVILGKPASVTEKITLALEARDSSPYPGDGVNHFKDAIANHSYFQNALGKTNEVRLLTLSPPQSVPDGKPFVTFTLECRYPEKTR